MNTKEALEIIAELAGDNMLDPDDLDVKDSIQLIKQAEMQDEALGVVQNLIDEID